MANTTLDRPVRVFARELHAIRFGFRVRRAIGVAFQGNRWHRDNQALGQPLFKMVVFRFAVRQAQSPAVIVDDDGNVVRVFERGRGAVERRVVELPLRRRELPDQLREIMPVFIVAEYAAFSGEVKLVPPFQLGLWRQGRLVGFRAADQITADRDQSFAAFRPQRRDHVGRACTPVKSGKDRFPDRESIHQVDDIDADYSLLTVPKSSIGQKAGGTVTAQIRDDHPVARRRQQRCDIDKTVNVVRPAVQENDRGPVGGAVTGMA